MYGTDIVSRKGCPCAVLFYVLSQEKARAAVIKIEISQVMELLNIVQGLIFETSLRLVGGKW